MEDCPADLRHLLESSLIRSKARRLPCSRCQQLNLDCDSFRPCKQCSKSGHKNSCDAVQELTSACSACKVSKVKCDRKRPCSNCIRRGKGSECCDPPAGGSWAELEERRLVRLSSSSTIQQPETPLAAPSHVDVWSDFALSSDGSDKQVGSLYPLLVKMSQAGYCKTSLLMMINSMGPDIRSAMCAVVEGIMKKPISDWRVGASLSAANSSDAVYLRNFAKLKESKLSLGYWTVHWRPGGMLREKIEISKGLGHLLKRNPEEILSRAASCEFELPSSDLEFLCVLLEDLYCFADTTMVRYGRVCRRCPGSKLGESCFVRVLSVKSIDEQKRLISSTHSMELLDANDWDKLHHDPSSNRCIYLQLMYSMGVVRTAEELLDRHKQDMVRDPRDDVLSMSD
uniref:Zn(2)-C6 fungal-type domain-containing protein n=1 Tax=Guillardia theta TaxID=55529 RepID=A0A7S4JAR6_GUITH|mmetsp:Transcript_14442/g.49331  ORF Transcript_14442/g.49331 Transcript_14442/m.49331 type:complete len:398 (+) Transcript_14442:213-1406(+)